MCNVFSSLSDMQRSSLDERIEGTPDSHSSSDGTLKSPALGDDQQHQVRRSRAGRVRTVLTEKQLNMLKSCYQVNKRPDALVKEQLVELTGLSPRVVRVWFQNKRCKDKKKLALLQEKVSSGWPYCVGLHAMVGVNVGIKSGFWSSRLIWSSRVRLL